jgi:hypothetical protein
MVGGSATPDPSRGWLFFFFFFFFFFFLFLIKF